MADKKVKVRLRPLKSIGGIGNAGDEVMMTVEDAKQYFDDGFIEYVDEADQLSAVNDQQTDTEEDHKIMKPRSKRK